MQIPSVFWIVVLVGGPLLAEWLNQYFGGTDWARPVSGLLVIGVVIAKAVQERNAPPAATPTVEMDRESPAQALQEPRGWVSRTLW